MSLCYDFEKWTIISLASVAISLTVGLVLMQYAHGQTDVNYSSLGYLPENGKNYSSLLNNSHIGEDDPEISCVGISWGNYSSTSCDIVNYTKYRNSIDNLMKERQQAEKDFLNNITGQK